MELKDEDQQAVGGADLCVIEPGLFMFVNL